MESPRFLMASTPLPPCCKLSCELHPTSPPFPGFAPGGGGGWGRVSWLRLALGGSWFIPPYLPQSTTESTVKRASLLGDMHLRSIRTKLLLMSRNEEANKHLEVRANLSIWAQGTPDV